MNAARQRGLLAALNDPAFNDTLRALMDDGLVVFVLTHTSVEFRLTNKGRVWLSSAETFHPSGSPA